MSFVRNDAINRVNLHCGIQAFAQGAGGVFVLVFLLRAGVSIPLALVAQAAIVLGRFIIRPALLPLAKRLGLKPMLMFGTVAMAAQYPVLAEVQGVGGFLLALCVVKSVGEVFYWLSFNANFAALGDAEHRGHQVSARDALVAIVSIVAPLLGAMALVNLGARPAFALIALVQLLAVMPLLGIPNIPVKFHSERFSREARTGTLLAALDGWFDAFFLVLWQIALFVTVRQSLSSYGGAVALAGFVGAVCGLLLGRHVDAGHGRRAVLIAFGATTFVVLLRATSLASPGLAVIANALGTVALILMSPVIGTVSYNLAKTSPCPFRFHVATEAGWDIGCFVACLLAAALFESGVPLSTIELLSLPAVGASIFVLWRLYPRRPGFIDSNSATRTIG